MRVHGCDDPAMLRQRNENCIIYESVFNCDCDCDARANPRNEHCIVYASVFNCDCAAMKIGALAHRNCKFTFRPVMPGSDLTDRTRTVRRQATDWFVLGSHLSDAVKNFAKKTI
jgi:hypothetical protein